jgi:Tol biopolymer transport system component
MDKPLPEESRRANDGRLDSWKKIAVYLKRDITTVQRWEKREGMPVHRHVHDKTGSVFAFRSELDAWSKSRSEQPGSGITESAPAPDAAAQPQQANPASRKRDVLVAGAVILAVLAVAGWVQFERSDHFWRNPLAGAVYQSVTGFGGQNEAAAVSRDGKFIAFLSDRGGRTDVWVTQLGSGQFHNLTRGIDGELVNPSIRTLGFTPDGSLVTFWLRNRGRPAGEDISIWAVPTLGGEPRPFLEGAAEAAWSPDGKQVVYHTTQPGDPLFVSDDRDLTHSRTILIGPAGLHNHFPYWPSDNLIYFIKGTLPDQLDIWRVGLQGEAAERITAHSARLTHPILLDKHTLLYLASAPDGSGPWIYGMDIQRRVPHRLTTGVEQYTSLSASADGRHVIATASAPERTLWRVGISSTTENEAPPTRITLATGTGFGARVGPDYLLYVAAAGTGESIWKIAGSAATQLWSAGDARIIGSPAVSADGRSIAFSARQHARTLLYTMASDGSRTRLLSDSLVINGAPAWNPDGRSLTAAVEENGVPHLFRIPVDGSAPTPLVTSYSVAPTWSPDGGFVVFSGPDVGTKFTVNAVSADKAAYSLPALTLTRGARHLALLPGGRRLVFLQGEIQHKNLWVLDLDSGTTRQLTHIPPDFDVRDFDISPDGREAVLERAQARSNIVAIDRSSL